MNFNVFDWPWQYLKMLLKQTVVIIMFYIDNTSGGGATSAIWFWNTNKKSTSNAAVFLKKAHRFSPGLIIVPRERVSALKRKRQDSITLVAIAVTHNRSPTEKARTSKGQSKKKISIIPCNRFKVSWTRKSQTLRSAPASHVALQVFAARSH